MHNLLRLQYPLILLFLAVWMGARLPGQDDPRKTIVPAAILALNDDELRDRCKALRARINATGTDVKHLQEELEAVEWEFLNRLEHQFEREAQLRRMASTLGDDVLSERLVAVRAAIGILEARGRGKSGQAERLQEESSALLSEKTRRLIGVRQEQPSIDRPAPQLDRLIARKAQDETVCTNITNRLGEYRAKKRAQYLILAHLQFEAATDANPLANPVCRELIQSTSEALWASSSRLLTGDTLRELAVYTSRRERSALDALGALIWVLRYQTDPEAVALFQRVRE